jgi:hypothetical protein
MTRGLRLYWWEWRDGLRRLPWQARRENRLLEELLAPPPFVIPPEALRPPHPSDNADWN